MCTEVGGGCGAGQAKGIHSCWRTAYLGPSCSPGTAAATLGPFFSTDFWHQKNTDYNNSPFHISQCFVLKLSDLQTVNVGLFDQYFRLTGW